MKTEVAIITETDRKVLKSAISRANKTHGWNIKVSFIKYGIYEMAEITTSTSEQILFLGIYMGRLGF